MDRLLPIKQQIQAIEQEYEHIEEKDFREREDLEDRVQKLYGKVSKELESDEALEDADKLLLKKFSQKAVKMLSELRTPISKKRGSPTSSSSSLGSPDSSSDSSSSSINLDSVRREPSAPRSINPERRRPSEEEESLGVRKHETHEESEEKIRQLRNTLHPWTERTRNERCRQNAQFPQLGMEENAEMLERIERHRQPKKEGSVEPKREKDYEPHSFAKAVNEAFKNKLEEPAIKEELKRATPDQQAIIKAEIKEKIVWDLYHQKKEAVVREGFYDPAVIPHEMVRDLGPPSPVPDRIENPEDLEILLIREVRKFARESEPEFSLTEHQREHLEADIIKLMYLYLKAYPDKSYKQAFVLARDAIRFLAYQEKYDKNYFTGSDHGCNHASNNIQGVNELAAKMNISPENAAKMLFLSFYTHMLHDIGYSVGLSLESFSCCSDHPMIGAMMIEAHRDYFVDLIGEDAYNALHFSVLQHATMMPDLTTGTTGTRLEGADFPHDRPQLPTGDVNLRLLRSLTSISDACAATYDRKTQFFWEQPGPLIAAARFRTFLQNFPTYQVAFRNPDNLDKLAKSPNPLDQFAAKIYRDTKAELMRQAEVIAKAVDPKLQELFKQAIEHQFNSMSTQITLGQYGATLSFLSAVANPDHAQDPELHPEFKPEIHLGLSMMYGVLNDLYGPSIAQNAYKKLCKEFSGDEKKLERAIGSVAQKAQEGGEEAVRERVDGDVADMVVSWKEPHSRLEVVPRAAPTPGKRAPTGRAKSMAQMDTLRDVVSELGEVARSSSLKGPEKEKLLSPLFNFVSDNKQRPLPNIAHYVQEKIFDKLNPTAASFNEPVLRTLEKIDEILEKNDFYNPNVDKTSPGYQLALRAYSHACNIVGALITNDTEYAFIERNSGEEPPSQEEIIAMALEVAAKDLEIE